MKSVFSEKLNAGNVRSISKPVSCDFRLEKLTLFSAELNQHSTCISLNVHVVRDTGALNAVDVNRLYHFHATTNQLIKTAHHHHLTLTRISKVRGATWAGCWTEWNPASSIHETTFPAQHPILNVQVGMTSEHVVAACFQFNTHMSCCRCCIPTTTTTLNTTLAQLIKIKALLKRALNVWPN